MSDPAVRPPIPRPHGWRALLPSVRKREAERLRDRIDTIQYLETRAAEDYRRVCDLLEDATHAAEEAEGRVNQVRQLLTRWAPDLAATHPVLLRELDDLLQLGRLESGPQV